jgi:hypothetical protein
MKKNFNVCARVSVMGMSALVAFGCTTKPTATSGGTASGVTSVTTFHNDPARTGQNLNESILTRTNVNSTSFGKIAAIPLDGQVYAQPLVASGIQMNGTTKNLVFVATEHDSVYAFDEEAVTAGGGASTAPLWQRSFLGDSEFTCPASPCVTLTSQDTLAPNIYPEIGITATPVIDTNAGLIYVVAVDKENGTIAIRLHALSLVDGSEQGSTLIQAAMPAGPAIPGVTKAAAGINSTDNMIHFQAQFQLARAGLVLANGNVYIAFSTWNDLEPDHGWLLGYSTQLDSNTGKLSLALASTYMSTPSTGNGSFWMSGGAPAVDDSGNLFAATGNGDYTYLSSATSPDLSDSVLKMSPGGASGMELSDYFTPYNWKTLAQGDVDVGSGGVLLLPDSVGSAAHPHLMVAGGKQGSIYLLDRDNLGKLSSSATSNTNLVQEDNTLVAGGTNHGPGLYGVPSFYNGNVLFMPAVGVITSVPVTNGTLDIKNAKKAPTTYAEKQRGSTLSISANGTSEGIAWYIDPSAYLYSYNYAGPAGGATTVTSDGPGILMAFSTDDLSTPLYQSPSSGADAAGNAVKFSVPTVANGLVFVGCSADNGLGLAGSGTKGELSIYGLRDRSISIMNPPQSSGATTTMNNTTRTYASINGGALSWIKKFVLGMLANVSLFSF